MSASKFLAHMDRTQILSSAKIFCTGLIFCVFCLVLNTISSAQTRPSLLNTKTYWQGEESCADLFETPVPRLPGGSPLIEILGEDAVVGNYRLSGGSRLQITVYQPRKISVMGRNFEEAYRDLMTRRPLQDRIDRNTSNRVVLADVRYMPAISGGLRKNKAQDLYMGNPNTLILKVSARVRVAEWSAYAIASEADQNLWDRFQCESYHHELGHILVAAQILEEAEADFLAVEATNFDDFIAQRKALFDDLFERIKTRQQDYHDEIELMGPELSDSRPYMELPFTWLVDNSDESIYPR